MIIDTRPEIVVGSRRSQITHHQQSPSNICPDSFRESDPREQIVGLLQNSVDMQADSKYVGGVFGLGGGMVVQQIVENICGSTGLSWAAGLAMGGLGIGVAAYMWHKSAEPLQQAVELNQKTNSFTQEEFLNIYQNMP